MAKRNQVTSGRFVVGSTWLTSPARADIKAGHGYWLGASSSPDYVLVLEVTDDSIVYVNAHGLTRSTIVRWVGEDLISKGGATVKCRAIDDENSDSPFAHITWERMLRHGAPVVLADYDRQEVSLRGIGKADHYGIAKNYGVLTDWDGGDCYVVECVASTARAFAADARFEVTGIRTINPCPVS
jgi:hypothetical protein